MLEDGGDARFLSKSEIEGWCGGARPSGDLGEAIAARKTQHFRWARYSPPDAISAGAQREEAEPIRPIDRSRTLHGVGISPGIASGAARIVGTASETRRTTKGEILVCREPLFELSPLFGIVGAVVSEEGGMLDHSGILVREYGVPAVFQVPRATDLIRTGERIVVDGDRGLVRWENGAGL